MRKDRKQDLNRLQNQLLAEEVGEKHTARIYNTDHTDVDLEEYAYQVCEKPKRRSCLGVVILGLLAITALFLYLAWGGSLPWK